MRSQEDVKIVCFTSKGSVTIDLERAEQDVVYQRLAGQHDMTTLEQRDLVLKKYVAFHFGSERMFTTLPSAMGPGDVFPFELEVRNVQYGYGSTEEPAGATSAV